jgi:hypothetical protein
MELIRTIREKSQTRKQQELHRQAEDIITLSDFDHSIYIAYAGTPLVPVKEDWTSKEIVQKLSEIRQNYINSKKKELCL